MAVLALALLVLVGLVTPVQAHPEEQESEDTGLPLLRRSAVAGRLQPYAGTLFTTSGSVLEVRNVPGQGFTVDGQPVDPGAPAGGMLAPTEGMLRALGAHYQVLEVGGGTVGGRSARVVQASRSDGRLAARYWIDEASGVLLRREVGQLSQAFVSFAVSPVRLPVAAPDAPAGLDFEAVSRLRSAGWSFPVVLPGSLELFGVAETGGYLRLGYSDGLSVVSVFVQRGDLDEELPKGWHSQRRDGHTIWVRDAAGVELIWASGGHVYTVYADAPADVVQVAISGLPHEAEPGFWSRLGRGASRVLSWVNPFS